MGDEIGKLRAALARLERGNGRRYSADMRKRIRRVALGMYNAGTGWQRIGATLGIPHETVRRLCRADAGAFVAVDVARDSDRVRTLTVVTPDGYRVEGLDVAGEV